MSATLEKLTAKRVVIEIPIDEDDPTSDPVRIVYQPDTLTKKHEREFNEIASESPSGNRMVGASITLHAFLLVVREWDLKWNASDPEVIPLTEEGLDDVPVPLLQYFLNKIGEDQKPDPTTKK
jgi:hypothetical protein